MIKTLLDTDLGTFSDDILALLFLLKHPEIELKGITIVGEDKEIGADFTKQMLKSAGKQAPVYTGAKVPKESADNKAADFLVNEITSHKGEYNLVAIGQLTNVASALTKEPNLLAYLNSTYIMGGALYRSYELDSYTPEYNFAKDPKAAEKVVCAKGSKILVPLDVTMNAVVKEAELKKLKELGELERKSLELIDRCYLTEEMHDSLAVIAMTNPEITTIEKRQISIREDGVVLTEGTETDVCLDFDYDKFKKIFDGIIYKN